MKIFILAVLAALSTAFVTDASAQQQRREPDRTGPVKAETMNTRALYESCRKWSFDTIRQVATIAQRNAHIEMCVQRGGFVQRY